MKTIKFIKNLSFSDEISQIKKHGSRKVLKIQNNKKIELKEMSLSVGFRNTFEEITLHKETKLLFGDFLLLFQFEKNINWFLITGLYKNVTISS